MTMGKGRLEAFSDGALAIIITIMVLELKVPHNADISALSPLLPVFLSYALSFIYIGIYWNNHHHLLHTAQRVSAPILWANLHLLFWLSLVPFTTAWMGENSFARDPTAVYGFVLLMAAGAYWLLQQAIMRTGGENHLLTRALGKDLKGKLSLVLYFVAIFSTALHEWIACGIYALVALIWLIPDRRISSVLLKEEMINPVKPEKR